MDSEVNIDINEEGAEVQELAEPAVDDEQTLADDDIVNSNDDNSKYAAARRKAEAELRREREKHAEEKANLEAEIIGGLGLTDIEGNLITTRDGLKKHREVQAEEALKAFAMRSGVSEEELKRVIDSHPAVIEAKATKEAAQREAATKRLNEKIKNISSIDSDIKTVDDLVNSENYNEVKRRVAEGYDLVDAYKLANYDKLMSRSLDGAKQSALNHLNSKSHLTSTTFGASGAEAEIPADIKQMYKQLLPGMSDKEISEHYAKYKK
jgi:hypothetical protein